MSGLTTIDEVEFNVPCFVGSGCHGSGRAFLQQLIFIKSFLNVVCLKVDQQIVKRIASYLSKENTVKAWTENCSNLMFQALLPCEVENEHSHPPGSVRNFCSVFESPGCSSKRYLTTQSRV